MSVREQSRFPILLSAFVYKMCPQFNYVSLKKESLYFIACFGYFLSFLNRTDVKDIYVMPCDWCPLLVWQWIYEMLRNAFCQGRKERDGRGI